jgi:hypothetical protein
MHDDMITLRMRDGAFEAIELELAVLWGETA